MKTSHTSPSAIPWLQLTATGLCLTALALFVGLLVPSCLAAPLADEKQDPPAARANVPAEVEVQFIDNSMLKITIKDQKIELTTPHGKLSIPMSEIRRIEFATRVSGELGRKIDAAVADLGSLEFPKRESATAELLKLGARAYPALIKATENRDKEIARRAQEVIDKIKESMPEESLTIRRHDVIHLDESKIAGRIEGVTLKATTFQFGDVQVNLADMRVLRMPGDEPADDQPRDVIPDPGSPASLGQQNLQVGKVFSVRVTAAINGAVYGSDVYTADSTLATAALHAGVLKEGQTGVVRIRILPGQQQFASSTRRGVTTIPWQFYPIAYEFVTRRNR